MYGFLPIDPARLPPVVQPYVPDISYRSFLLVLAVVTALPFGVASTADLDREGGWGSCTLLAEAGLRFHPALPFPVASPITGGP